MKPLTITLLLIAGLVAFILAGLLATQVGGIAIRRASQLSRDSVFEISQPVIRGVPVTVHWTGSDSERGTINLIYRDAALEQLLASAPFAHKKVRVVFPCEHNSRRATLLLVRQDTGAILNQESITLQSPGHDCAAMP